MKREPFLAHICCVLLLFGTLQCCKAYPMYYYDPAQLEAWLGLVLPTPPTCVSHPSKDYFPYVAPHGTPRIDPTIAFAIRSATTDAVVATLCPGATYKIKVYFGPSSVPASRRLGLLTADPPVATFTDPTPTPGCGNRVDLGGSNEDAAKNSFTATFVLPCSFNATRLTFKITSAGKSSPAAKGWTQNGVAVSVHAASSSSCVVQSAKCSPSSPRPSPSRKPSPARKPSPRRKFPPLRFIARPPAARPPNRHHG